MCVYEGGGCVDDVLAHFTLIKYFSNVIFYTISLHINRTSYEFTTHIHKYTQAQVFEWMVIFPFEPLLG